MGFVGFGILEFGFLRAAGHGFELSFFLLLLILSLALLLLVLPSLLLLVLL